MKATARIITGSVRARAQSVGNLKAVAIGMPVGVSVTAAITDKTNIFKWLRVFPSEPQQLVWLVPQYGVDYTIESNTNWQIK